MRLRSISFEPFGALRGVDLDFAADRTLHVVWGPNEAGKSTALRGIVDFFYGIPRDSADQHERGLELRIRARLADDTGRELDLVRRKGTKDPLRDGATDAPARESELARMLGGVDRATFTQLHALDHVRLREGADSILRGEGRLGELMLEATTGATGLIDRLQALHDEANALYRPRAKSTELAGAIEAWKTAARESGRQMLSHNAWEVQERGIAATRRGVADAEVKLKEARGELASIEKLLLLEDPMAKLRNRRTRRAQLGEVADVPEGTAARRDELAQEASSAAEEAELSEGQLPRLRGELEAAQARARAVDTSFDRELAHALRASIASLERARSDASVELEAIARARDEALERLGQPPDEIAWAERGVDARALTRAETCAAERRASQRALAVAERALREAEARLAVEGTSADAVAVSAAEATSLASAIAAARRASAAAEALDQLAAREIDLAQRLASALAATGSTTASALVSIAVPDPSAVDDEARRRAAVAVASAAIDHDRRGVRERAARAEAELASIRDAGAVPSESDLEAARGRRDVAMDEAYAAIEAGGSEPARAALRGVERAQRDADAIADRLRREASRVEHVAALEAELQGADRAARAIEARAREAASEEADRIERWRAAWPALADVPLDATRAWLARRGEVISLASELDAVRARAAELTREVAEGAAHLAPLDLGGRLGSKLALDAAIAAAERRLETIRADERRREERSAAAARARSDVEAARAARDHARQADDAAEQAWRSVIAEHRMGTPGTTEEALATLVCLAGATRDTSRHGRIAARLATIDRELGEARDAWRRALDAVGLEGLPADEVMARVESAREARSEIPHIEDAIAQRLDAVRAARARAERASARLTDIGRRAGVPDEQLRAAEERASVARHLEREIAALEATVVERSGAGRLAEAEERLRDVDFVVEGEKAEQLRADIEALEATWKRDLHDLGAQVASLDEMERGSRAAADLAETAESHLARARGLARRAAVARAAVALLEREVERHRSEREGPVLRRASELFHTLTARRWTGLRVGDGGGDVPEIRCVRGDRELGVKELSEGTRDQLYLALRLAALEHHAQVGAPLPLILDDVLVHFDDERAEAAIVALAEVAKTLQVLLFTHEQRIADLARRILAPGAVVVHGLARTP